MVPPPRFKNSHHFSRTNGKGGWYCNVCTPAELAPKESMTAADGVRHERTRAHTRKVEKSQPQEEVWQPPADTSGWEGPPIPYADTKLWEHQGRVDKLRDIIPFWRDGVIAAERGEEIGRMEDFLERLEEEWETNYGGKNSGDWGKDIGLDMWGGDGEWATSQPANAWETREKVSWKNKKWGGGAGDWDVAGSAGAWGRQEGEWGVPHEEQWGAIDQSGWGAREGDWGASTATESERMTGSEVASRRAHIPIMEDDHVPDRDAWTFVERIACQEDASMERKMRMHQFFEMSTEQKINHIQELVRLLRTQC